MYQRLRLHKQIFIQHDSENINRLKASGHYKYRQFKHTTILRSAHTVYLCVLCGSENKLRLFPHTALTDWFL